MTPELELLSNIRSGQIVIEVILGVWFCIWFSRILK